MRLDQASALRRNGQLAKYATLNGNVVWQLSGSGDAPILTPGPGYIDVDAVEVIPITTDQRVFRHFYNESVGAEPADISHVFSTPWVSTTVAGRQRRDIEGSERGLRLRGLSTQVGKRGFQITSLPSVADYELFTSFRWALTGGTGGSDLMNRLKLMGRVNGEQAVNAGHHPSTRARVTRWNTAGSFSELAAGGGTSFPLGTVVSQRVRVQGNNLKVRVWEWGTREPMAWTLDTTVDISGASHPGIMCWGTSAMDLDLIVWGVGACAPFTGLVNDFAPQYNQSWDWQNFPYELMFPFKSNVNIWYPDGWAENRDSGTRAHRAVDCYENHPSNNKGAWIYASHDGTINSYMGGHPQSSGGYPITPGAGGGYNIRLDHPSGDFSSHYLHMGNDVTNDHNNAFAPHPTLSRVLQPGDVVTKGQHIGYLGDSGVTGSGPHLHFELRSQKAGLLTDPQGSDFGGVGGHYNPRWDPYPVLKDAQARGDFPI
jgi:hypothetical protein